MTKDLYAWSSEFAIKIVGVGLSVIGILAFIMFIVCSLLCKKIDERKVYLFFGLVPMILAMLVHLPWGNNYPVMQDCSNHTSTTEGGSTLLSFDVTTSSAHLVEKRDVAQDCVDTYIKIFDRFKRAAFLDDVESCNAPGCPTSQTWCYYTPIIEIPQLIAANILGVIGYPIAFSLSSSLFSKMLAPNNLGFWMGLMTSIGSLSRMTGPIFVTYIYSNYGTRYTFGLLLGALSGTFVLACLLFKRLVPMDINKNNPNSEDSNLNNS